MVKAPDSIQNAVLTQWLQGVARDMTAINVGISGGTVSRIVKQYGEEHPDFNTLISYVVNIKNQGADVKQLASAMRLGKRLKKLSLDENQVEDFLDDVAEHCFRKGMSTAEFINEVNEVARVSSKIEVPIDELQNFIADKQKESNELGFKIIFRRIEMDQLMREHNATKAQLQAFMAWPPSY
jgi:transcriptional regulator